MKRAYLLLALAALLLFGCTSAPKAADDAPLLTAGESVLMTGNELRLLVCEEDIRSEMLEKKPASEKALFNKSAAKRAAAYIAGELGFSADERDFYAEYDEHLTEIADIEAYPGQLELFSRTLAASGVGEEAFREWVVSENKAAYMASLLAEDIAAGYNYEDPIAMQEAVSEELTFLCEIYGIKINYPETEGLDFEHIT